MRYIYGDSYDSIGNRELARDQATDSRYFRNLDAVATMNRLAQAEAARQQEAIDRSNQNALNWAHYNLQAQTARENNAMQRAYRNDQLNLRQQELDDKADYYNSMIRMSSPEERQWEYQQKQADKAASGMAQEEQDLRNATALSDMLNRRQELNRGVENLPTEKDWQRKADEWFTFKGGATKDMLSRPYDPANPNVTVEQYLRQFVPNWNTEANYPEILKLYNEAITRRKAEIDPVIQDMQRSGYGAYLKQDNNRWVPNMNFRYYRPPTAGPAQAPAMAQAGPVMAQVAEPQAPPPDPFANLSPGTLGERRRNKSTGEVIVWNGARWLPQ